MDDWVSRGGSRRAQLNPSYGAGSFAQDLLHQELQVGEFLARSRGGAADEVEHLAVTQAVIRQPLDAPVLVEIDRDHAAIDFLLRQERGALGPLRDVVE